MKLLIAALALSTSMLAPAQAHTIAAMSAPDAKSDAETLVAQLAGDGAMARLGARAFDHGVEEEIGGNPAFAADPALKTHVVAQVRAEFLRIMQRELPTLRSQLAALVLAEMTAAEISDTLIFFQSPVGRKLKEQVYASMADQPGQNAEEVKQAAMTAVMTSLAPEDYPALMAFGASSAAQKMQTVNPKIAATSEAWANKVTADNEAHLRAFAVKATADYLKTKKG